MADSWPLSKAAVEAASEVYWQRWLVNTDNSPRNMARKLTDQPANVQGAFHWIVADILRAALKAWEPTDAQLSAYWDNRPAPHDDALQDEPSAVRHLTVTVQTENADGR